MSKQNPRLEGTLSEFLFPFLLLKPSYLILMYYLWIHNLFQSTDVDEFDKRWEFISGFSGSYSNIIVTANKAALWTDGRFSLQADEEIDCHWLLFKEGRKKIKTMSQWLRQELPKGGRLGINPKLVSEHMWNRLSSELRGSGIELVGLNVSLVDVIWPDDFRKARRSKEAFILDVTYTGNFNNNFSLQWCYVFKRLLCTPSLFVQQYL